MNLSYDVIKIQLVDAGYITKNYPYHLLSTAEMCDGFLSESEPGQLTGYFADFYPCVDEELREPYDELVKAIQWHLNEAKTDDEYLLPDWVQSYMLGVVVGPKSDVRDRHDLFVSLGCDNMDDIFGTVQAGRCYEVSSKWVARYGLNYQAPDGTMLRPATMFGEPHVLKSLRLAEVR